MTEGVWIALIGLAATAFGSLGLWFGRRKLKAEAAQILTDAAVALVEPLNKRILVLEDEVKALRDENKRLEKCIDGLESQNTKLRGRVRELEEVNRSLSLVVEELRERERQARGGKAAKDP